MLLSKAPCLSEHVIQALLPYFSKNKNKPQTTLLLKNIVNKNYHIYSHYPDPATIQFKWVFVVRVGIQNTALFRNTCIGWRSPADWKALSLQAAHAVFWVWINMHACQHPFSLAQWAQHLWDSGTGPEFHQIHNPSHRGGERGCIWLWYPDWVCFALRQYILEVFLLGMYFLRLLIT